MHCIVYSSVATRPFEEQELRALLHQWRANNQRHGITGLLLYAEDGRILQVLEGEKAAIESMFTNIAHSCRHFDLVKLADGEVATRTFSEWSMGFCLVSQEGFAPLAGYLAPAQAVELWQPGAAVSGSGSPEPTLLGLLLQEFAASMQTPGQTVSVSIAG